MAIAQTLARRTIAERFRGARDEETIWDEVSEQTQALPQRTIQSGLEEELTRRLYAPRYGRSRQRARLAQRGRSSCRDSLKTGQPTITMAAVGQNTF